MNSAYMTRRVTFAAAHRYWREEWSEERNRSVFGACANPHGHGHNYVLEATVGGTIDPETGYCIDLARLDTVLDEAVVSVLDHQHINHVVPELLHRLRLREDEDLYVEYYGGGPPS